jgi:hypothetical protein
MWRSFLAGLVPWVCLAISFIANTVHAEVMFDWSTATNLSPGVKWVKYDTTSPRLLSINVVQVDTWTPRLRFTTIGRRQDWVSNVSETDKFTTRQWINASQSTDRPITLAINATPWSPFPSEDSIPANLRGLVVSDGILVSPGTSNVPAFIVNDVGIPRIQIAGPSTDITLIDLAVAGFNIVMSNGLPIASSGSLEPRTGYGISADERYIYLMTIDGRRYSSQGSTIGEVGQWLKFFGAWSGINMDGGGSTTLARWNSSTSSAQLLNVPNSINIFVPDNLEGSQLAEQAFFQNGLLPNERSLGNSLGIYYEPVPEVSSILLAWIGVAALVVYHRPSSWR